MRINQNSVYQANRELFDIFIQKSKDESPDSVEAKGLRRIKVGPPADAENVTVTFDFQDQPLSFVAYKGTSDAGVVIKILRSILGVASSAPFILNSNVITDLLETIASGIGSILDSPSKPDTLTFSVPIESTKPGAIYSMTGSLLGTLETTDDDEDDLASVEWLVTWGDKRSGKEAKEIKEEQKAENLIHDQKAVLDGQPPNADSSLPIGIKVKTSGPVFPGGGTVSYVKIKQVKITYSERMGE